MGGSCFIRDACLQFWAEFDQMKSAAYWWLFNLKGYPSVAKSEGLFWPNEGEHLENQKKFYEGTNWEMRCMFHFWEQSVNCSQHAGYKDLAGS